MIGVYGERDRITLTGGGNLSSFLGGNLMGVIGEAIPFGGMGGSRRGRPSRRPAMPSELNRRGAVAFPQLFGTPALQPAYN
jgi:hypothetical protein